jgi:biopolymer transport protein TolR
VARRNHNSTVMADINITPFTDVVLVLLIIFMLATPIIVGSGIKVDPPKAETSKTEEERFVTVSIDREGVLFLDNKKVTIDDLQRLLRTEVERKPGVMVKINGDRTIAYEKVINVLDATRSAGVIRYLLVAKRPQTKPLGGR